MLALYRVVRKWRRFVTFSSKWSVAFVSKTPAIFLCPLILPVCESPPPLPPKMMVIVSSERPLDWRRYLRWAKLSISWL